jgi:hypothetical protein
MAVKLLQSLVQRGAPVLGARVTGLESKGYCQAVLPATILSLLRHPTPGHLVRGTDRDAERGAMRRTAVAVLGTGRSSRWAGVTVSTRVARSATGAVLSGWPALLATACKPFQAFAGFASSLRKIRPFGLLNPSANRVRIGPKGAIAGRAR